MVSEDRQCQVEIEEMTLGPYGVGHLDGKALLVANSAPGDVLQVSVSDARRDYSIARLEKIISRGPSRRVAPCPFCRVAVDATGSKSLIVIRPPPKED